MKMEKIIEYRELPRLLQNIQNQKIVLTGGCFDLIHYGHYCLLKNAKKLGDILLVTLESDEFIEKRKKRKPIHTQNQRAEIIAGFEFVDIVIKLPFFNKDEDYFDMVQMIKPSFIAVSEGDPQINNKLKQAQIVGSQIVEVCKNITNLSTTRIINEPFISRD